MPDANDSWSQLIAGLRQGDARITSDFCRQYGEPLEKIAAKHLPAGLRRRLGPEDVVQSVCRTFFRRAREGQFELDDSEGLWRLLCAITLTKVREQARYHLRQKRGVQREVPLTPPGLGDSLPSIGPSDPAVSPAQAAAFTEQFQQLIAGLDDEERQLVDLKLQQCTNEEAAEKLGCSERTVRRLMKRIQSRLERVFEVSAAD